MASKDDKTNYALGSVLNHVLLHQTIIGLESIKQMEKAGDYPDIVIGCFGGGSNFAGISFPFLHHNFTKGKKIRCIAIEPASCPKLTRGTFQYDFSDTEGFTPLIPMFTLGHNFVPDEIHAGGLRYHGAGSLVSQLLKDKLIEAQSVMQLETFEAGVKFARSEGIIPAPESCHAIAGAIREALIAKKEGIAKTILFNLSGHGLVDLAAYDQYFSGSLANHAVSDSEIAKSVGELEKLI
jgi:tryptophan synthase beta chain